MTPKNDPLIGLERSIDAETAVVERRFSDADRFTRGGAREPTRGPRAVRSTFSFPPHDHELLTVLQGRCLAKSVYATKSQVVRAGLHALMDLPSDALLRILDRVEPLQRGPRSTP